MSNETANIIMVVSTTVFHVYMMYALYFWFAECGL